LVGHAAGAIVVTYDAVTISEHDACQLVGMPFARVSVIRPSGDNTGVPEDL
jgi:hypothetical protein